MAALTADRNTINRGAGRIMEIPVAASTTIYAGGGVCVLATGYAVPAADTAGHITMGVAATAADNSAGSAGDINVLVYQEGTFEFVAAGQTQANVGDLVYWSDDQTVADAGTTTNDIPAGKIVKFISATAVEVLIDSAVGGGI